MKKQVWDFKKVFSNLETKGQWRETPISPRATSLHTLRSVNDVTEGITHESPMGASWVIPRKVDKMVWISAQWVIPNTRQGRGAGIVVGITQESPIVFSSQSVVSLPCLVNSRRNHPSLTINLESGTHTKLATLLGSTHGGFLGDSFCDIINGA